MAYLPPQAGAPADNYGSDGDTVQDYKGRFLWGPKGLITAGSWAGTAQSIVGPTGPAGPAPNLPVIANMASVWGPAAQFAGTTVGTGQTPANFMGSNTPHMFVPAQATALTGVTVSNYAASGATIYFYLYDLTAGAIVFNYNSGNGIANNTSASVTANVALIAGHQYQWQAQRVTAAATTMNIFPQYLSPASTPSALTPYTPAVLTSSTTVAKGGTIAFAPPGMSGQGLIYRNSASSYLYFIEAWLAGSGVSDIYLFNQNTNANHYTQDSDGGQYTTLTSTLTRYTFGPFVPTRWPFVQNNQYSINTYAPNGSLTVTQALVTLTIGQ